MNDEFIPLSKLYNPEVNSNIYLSDGFIPKYGFNNIIEEDIRVPDKIIITKRSLKEYGTYNFSMDNILDKCIG